MAKFMTAEELFEEVKVQVFELYDNGEVEVIFGDHINDKFTAYLKDENEIEVDFCGRTMSIQCDNIDNPEYVARLIMHCFAKLYLNK